MNPSSRAPVADSEGAYGLHAVGMLDLLEHDPRPTFVLDGTDSINNRNASISLAYWNQALAKIDDGGLLTSIKGDNVTVITEEQQPVRSEFHTWIATQETPKPYTCRGHRWTKFVLTSRWTVVFGALTETSALCEKAESKEAVAIKSVSRSADAAFDWTGKFLPMKMSPHVAWVRSIDWSQTSMGPISDWSLQLRSVANLVMQDPQPAVLFWGTDLTMIYNEAYIKFLGNLHPCIGHNARAVLASVWSRYFEPLIVQNLDGKATDQKDLAIHINREGFVEEAYFSIKFLPVLDAAGATVGHYEPLTETVSCVDATLIRYPHIWV